MRKKSLLIIALVVALEASAYGWNNFGHETMLALPYFAREPFASAQDVAEALRVQVAVAVSLVADLNHAGMIEPAPEARLAHRAANSLFYRVARDGIEPPTP